MRVLQLIDSLRPGGAEQMAVNYANALARRGQESFLCCTRMEGLLKNKLSPEVGYKFLEKEHTLDRRAYMRLREFVKEHKIQIIQAHSSSYFLAVLIKMSTSGVRLIWHDHYGKNLDERKDIGLRLLSGYFDGVISVNEALKAWAKEHLKVKNVVYIKNFLPDSLSSFDRLRMTWKHTDRLRMKGKHSDKLRVTKLKGEHKIKIICVANLRSQKDHFNLTKAFELVLKKYTDLSLHLVGKDEENKYSKDLKYYLQQRNLHGNIFLYGEQENVDGFIRQATIGILSSSSEGLPVALLEYGREGIPVVCTKVGEIPEVIGAYGQVVKAGDPKALAKAIIFYIEHEEQRNKDAFFFQKKVIQEFSEKAIITEAMDFYQSIS